MVYTVIINIF